jgi:hypothetical protein
MPLLVKNRLAHSRQAPPHASVEAASQSGRDHVRL